jgi:5'-nucleotidase
MLRRRHPLLAALLAPLLVLVAACGDDDDGAGPAGSSGSADEAGTTTTEAPADPLRILVTDDDGVEGAGMDALVVALAELPDTEVTVVAPAADQSGTGDEVSPSPPAATDVTLPSGHEAVAVEGFPADAVTHALAEVFADDPPDLVVSGINAGQNLGPVAADLSGTVGAARTAARAGLPALAVSQGIGDEFDYATGVELTLDWIEEHREALLAGDVATDTVANLNVPSCTAGEIKGVVEVATATDLAGRDFLAPVDCTVATPASAPADDIDAFNLGYAALADVPLGDPPAAP